MIEWGHSTASAPQERRAYCAISMMHVHLILVRKDQSVKPVLLTVHIYAHVHQGTRELTAQRISVCFNNKQRKSQKHYLIGVYPFPLQMSALKGPLVNMVEAVSIVSTLVVKHTFIHTQNKIKGCRAVLIFCIFNRCRWV